MILREKGYRVGYRDLVIEMGKGRREYRVVYHDPGMVLREEGKGTGWVTMTQRLEWGEGGSAKGG